MDNPGSGYLLSTLIIVISEEWRNWWSKMAIVSEMHMGYFDLELS